MAKIQKTFTLIEPTANMRNLIQRRPDEPLPELAPAMTSKEAQKRWREKNKQPRMSRAEQFRLEREEQAQIKAEFEKEKAANRARFLREKKKEKEQKILDEKRKKGLPLVNVRPSQPTISWFVRQGPAKRKHDETMATDEDQQPPMPHPTQRDHQQEDDANEQPAPSPRSSTHLVTATTTDLLPLDPPPSSQPAPLASTQYSDDLDNFDNLEDLLPSASQMDRELRGQYSMQHTQSATADAPLRTPKAVRPPVPLFGDSKGLNSKFIPEVPMPLAALPAQVPASEVVERIKTATDYFSSQDWDLSSQDVRDIEGTVQSTVALRPSPRKTQQSSCRPEPSLPRAPVSPIAPASASAKQEVPLQSSQPPRFFGSSGDGVELLMGLWESRKLAQQEEEKRQAAQWSKWKRLEEEMLQREQLQRDLEEMASDLLEPLSQCSIHHHDDTEEPMDADLGLLQSELGTEDFAIANPASTAPWAECEDGGSELKELGDTTLSLLDSMPAAPRAQSDYGGSEFKELGNTTLSLLDPVSAAPQDESDYDGSEFKGLGEVTMSLLDPMAPVAPSQAESDYGDSGLKELGEEALNLLEEAAIASASAAAIPTVIVTPAADYGTAGKAMGQNSNTAVDPNVSFGIGDGSWLSDDDELDL